jgi:predicted nucleic acid-binding protein
MKGVFDTNILVDFLNGESRAASLIGTYTDKVISRITWMEVLVGATTPAEQANVRSFLGSFRLAELSPAISEAAVDLRRSHTPKLKLPDAIIYATAREEACNLVTRNTKDFPAAAADVTVPYTL